MLRSSLAIRTLLAPHTDFDLRLTKLVGDRCTNFKLPVAPHRSFWEEFAQKDKMLVEFLSPRRSSRIGHTARAIYFLKCHNVLAHSLLHFNPPTNSWNVSKDFERLALFGESILRNEVLVRTLRAFPEADEEIVTEVLRRVMSGKSIAVLYDALNLNRLLPADRRKIKPSLHQRQVMLQAILGEMMWFVLRTKATDRTMNNALFPPSDVLILHSLCAHSCESMIVESIFEQFIQALHHTKLLTKNFHESTPQQLTLKPRTVGRLSLTSVAVSNVPEERRDSVVVTPPLSPSASPLVFCMRVPVPPHIKVSKTMRGQNRLSGHNEGVALASQRTEKASAPSSSMSNERRLELTSCC